MSSVATAPRAKPTELEEARARAVHVSTKGDSVLIVEHNVISLWEAGVPRWQTTHCLDAKSVHEVSFVTTKGYVDLLNRNSVRLLRLAIQDGTRRS